MISENVLGNNIKKAMAERGMKQPQLTFDARVPQSRISDILLGRTKDPRISTVKKIAGALGLSIDYLVTDHGSDDSQRTHN